MLKRTWLLAFALIFVFLLSGCSALVPSLVQGWFTVTAIDSVETSAPTVPTEPTEVTVPAVACPEPTSGTLLLEQAQNGYCLLYPQAYSVVPANELQTSILIGGLLNVSDPRLDIVVEEANGRTTEEAADALQFDYAPGQDIVRSYTTVAGQEAIVLDKVPGQEFSRRVVFVYENQLYHLIFLPADPAQADIYERMLQLYQTVIDSFTLIPVVEPDVNNPATPDPAASLPTPEEVEQMMQLSLYLVEGVPNPLPAPQGWTIQPCEGMAPVFCVETDAGEMGAVSLDAYALRTYPDLHPILAEYGMPYGSIDVESQIYQEGAHLVLGELVTDFLASVAEDRRIGHPEWSLTPLAFEPIQMGELPGLFYGFVMTDRAGQVQERVLSHVAFDESHIYFVVAVYDPAAHWTLPSDETLLNLAPSLRQIVAELPLPKDETWQQ